MARRATLASLLAVSTALCALLAFSLLRYRDKEDDDAPAPAVEAEANTEAAPNNYHRRSDQDDHSSTISHDNDDSTVSHDHDDSTIPYEEGSHSNGCLLMLVLSRRWAEAESRVVSHPLEARVVHKTYGTALYQACLLGAPPDLVAALLRAFPKGPSVVFDFDQRDPFWLLAERSPKRRADTTLNAAILRCLKASDELSMFRSLETMCLLVRADVGALSTKNDCGKTPLEYLCHISGIKSWQQVSHDKAGDGGGGTGSIFGQVLLPEVPSKILYAVSFLVEESAAATWNERTVNALDVSTPVGLLVPVPLLTRAEQSISHRDHFLHRFDALCKAVDMNCGVPIPRCLIEWIAACHLPSLLRPLAEADANGNLVLHSFAADVHKDASGAYRAGEFGANFNRLVGRVLLSMHPRAAEVRNRTGRLPLHLAASACGRGGFRWGMESSLGSLGDIFMVFPGALGICDPVTGLLPFMMPSASGGVDAIGKVGDFVVNATYMLLRADPEQVRSGVEGWMMKPQI